MIGGREFATDRRGRAGRRTGPCLEMNGGDSGTWKFRRAWAHGVFALTPHQAPFSWVTGAILALIAWRAYTRVRRNIGRQHFAPARCWVSVTLLPGIVLLIAFGLRLQPPAMGLSLVGGLALGVALGLLGLRQTRFEVASDGLYYVPSAPLGIALSTLLVGRLLYRFLTAGVPTSGPGMKPFTTHLTPLTLALIGALAGYYAIYAAGLLRWSVRHRRAQPAGMPT